MIPRFAVFFNLTLEELIREVELAKRRSNLGAFYRVKCYKYIVDWQKRKDRDKPTEPYPEGKVRIRNRRRYEHLREIGVISERPNPQASEIEYIVTLKGLGQAVEVLSFLGTTLHFIIQNRVQGSAGSTVGSLRAGCPVKDVTFGFPPFAYNYHYPDVGVRMRGRIKLRREIWHEIMELTILAINCKVFNDPGDTSSTLVGESLKTFAHWTTLALLNNIGDDHFYPWDVDDEDKTDVYDAWAHQAMAWEEEAERLKGSAQALDSQGEYRRADNLWDECVIALERAAEAWESSKHPEGRNKAREARAEKEKILNRAGHWKIEGIRQVSIDFVIYPGKLEIWR